MARINYGEFTTPIKPAPSVVPTYTPTLGGDPYASGGIFSGGTGRSNANGTVTLPSGQVIADPIATATRNKRRTSGAGQQDRNSGVGGLLGYNQSSLLPSQYGSNFTNGIFAFGGPIFDPLGLAVRGVDPRSSFVQTEGGQLLPEAGAGFPSPYTPAPAMSQIPYGPPAPTPDNEMYYTPGGSAMSPSTQQVLAGGQGVGDPNNPQNGLDPNYNYEGPGGRVDYKDEDWNPGMPYKEGGYTLSEVLNTSQAEDTGSWYRTGFDYGQNYPDAFLGEIQGYNPDGTPMPQIAGYYIHQGKYYPIDLRKVNQAGVPGWKGYRRRGSRPRNSGGGSSGGGQITDELSWTI